MRNLLLIVLLVLPALLGCKARERQRLVGEWRSQQVEDIVGQVADKAQIDEWINTDKLKQAAGEFSDKLGLGASVGSLKIIFHQNGKLETITDLPGINTNKQGTWDWISFDPKTRIAKIKCVLNGQETEHDVAFDSRKEIELIPPNLAGLSGKVKFVKAK